MPDGVRVHHSTVPMAATPLRAAWRHADVPRVDRWIGPTDVVHGTNFVVPPTAAAAVVTIHDLTYLRFPEMCTKHVLQYPRLIDRALARGAVVHTVSDFVRGEVLDHYGLPEDRVVAVPNGFTPRGQAIPRRAAPSPAVSATSWRSARWNPARTSRGSSPPSTSWPRRTPTFAS